MRKRPYPSTEVVLQYRMTGMGVDGCELVRVASEGKETVRGESRHAGGIELRRARVKDADTTGSQTCSPLPCQSLTSNHQLSSFSSNPFVQLGSKYIS